MSELPPIPAQNPTPEKPKPLDEKWFNALELATKIDTLKNLDGVKKNRDKQQEEFFSGKTVNPYLDSRIVTAAQKAAMIEQAQSAFSSPEDIEKLSKEIKSINDLYTTVEMVQEKEQALLDLKAQIREEEKNDAVKRAYVWKINEKIAELRMLLCSVPQERMKRSGEPIKPEYNSRRFSRYSEYIYGKPSPGVFAYTIEEIKKACEPAASSESNRALKAAAEALLASLPDTSTMAYEDKDFALPDAKLVSDISAKTRKEMEPLIASIPVKPEGQKLVASEIIPAFDTALQALKADGWSAIEDENRKKMIVLQGKKKVVIPSTRAGTTLEIQKLIAHEIGTHVARRLNGERSRLMLLGTGLDRYAKAEEGVATLREQGVAGEAKEFPRLEYHLAVSLAKGLDGKPRDFRGVYKILEKWTYFKQLRKGVPEEMAKIEAKTEAYDFCVGTFRGTDSKTPGACLSKDIVYREGNIKVWRFLGKNQDDLVKLSLGKFDQSEDRHLAILSELGITDKDLEDLEQ